MGLSAPNASSWTFGGKDFTIDWWEHPFRTGTSSGWHHISFVQSKGKSRRYVDGEEIKDDGLLMIFNKKEVA